MPIRNITNIISGTDVKAVESSSKGISQHRTQCNYLIPSLYINSMSCGGGDGRESSSGGGSGVTAATANGHSSSQQQQQQQQPHHQPNTSANKRNQSQKDDKSSGLSAKDREERLRQLRDRQQMEKHQKLEELKEHAAAAQRFREQQENERRRRLEEMKYRDAERRSQVEERKRIIQQAEQDRREAVLRKTAEREQRMESKRRNERSSIVFAFGSSTPRMLDPKDNNSASYWSARRATSTTNVHLADTSLARRASECGETDLSRKRATSAHGLDRKPEEDLMTQSMTAAIPASAARRRTDLMPALPTLRDHTGTRTSPRHRSPGRALSLGRLDQLARPRNRNPPLAPLHETTTPSSSSRMTPPARTMSKSMSHLGPRPPRPHSLDIPGGHLDRGVSRSSVTLAPPRMTRAEVLRQKKLRGTVGSDGSNLTAKTKPASPGMRSGTVTPNSPSRPTSALSQGSNNSSQVSLRIRTSPRKPRPQSIAGSSLSSADKPREAVATPSRESRAMERKLSVGSASSGSKPARAKSAGSDNSAPATPARTPIKVPTPKKTPAQVKAESAAKKAAEKSKGTPKTKSTPKTTPLQSPAVESKPLPGAKEKKVSPPKEEKVKAENKKTDDVASADETQKEEPPVSKPNGLVSQDEVKISTEQKQEAGNEDKVVEAGPGESQTPGTEVLIEAAPVSDTSSIDKPKPEVKEAETNKPKNTDDAVTQDKDDKDVEDDTNAIPSKPDKEKSEEPEKTMAQKAAEKPVTGYATEEDYKAALAEKRRLAREAKERELELERQRQLEEEERERREEEEYLKQMEEQRKAEEERLRKAIEEAERNRQEEAKRKEEEEKQRVEAEQLEQQKRVEAEEKLRKEEEERQARKSRVAAIMARTRGKGGSNTPTKNEAKTPSEDGKNFGDGMMSTSMTDSMISSLVAAAEAEEQQESAAAAAEQPPKPLVDTQATSEVSSEPQDSEPPKAHTEAKSEPPTTAAVESQLPVSEKKDSEVSSSHVTEVITVDSTTSSSDMKGEVRVEVTTTSESSVVEDIISGISSVKVEEPHVNGDSPVPMDTTPTQSVDLLGSLSDVHSVNHNGVDNTPPQTSQGTENLLGSLEPLNSTHTSAITPAASNYDQIIDLAQTKLSNEDAVNSNPPSPFIAFEQNLNKKQSQENTSTVPDLLL
ncbi:hypothetical protein Pcinc_040036 [Petrolisthes cinctipes]|uniref:Ensconsin n=1 Tax=Petrolisthes cinctipes TaxID=88211 RepID=A0AAE1EIH9_PETCI|nr:hypothetical protein Pcinc_040036 [Petrolisthes cinctipes]